MVSYLRSLNKSRRESCNVAKRLVYDENCVEKIKRFKNLQRLTSSTIKIFKSFTLIAHHLFNSVLSKEKVLYHSVFDLFPLIYMCFDFKFRLFSNWKAERIPFRHDKKIYAKVITFFTVLCCMYSVIDGSSNPNDDTGKVRLVW